VNQRAHTSDEQDVQRAQWINHKAQIDMKAAHMNPVQDLDESGMGSMHLGGKYKNGKNKRKGYHGRSDGSSRSLALIFTEKSNV
jgi:hypothetical protein